MWLTNLRLSFVVSSIATKQTNNNNKEKKINYYYYYYYYCCYYYKCTKTKKYCVPVDDWTTK